MTGKLKYLVYLSIILSFVMECMESTVIVYFFPLKELKYIIVLITFLVCGIKILGGDGAQKLLFYSELKLNIMVCIVFTAISFICILQTHTMTYKTVEELAQLFIPFAYAFIIINWLSFKEIKDFMRICLLVSIVGYIITTGLNQFTLENVFAISFLNSFSVFESSDFAEISSGLAAFFIYYRKKMPVCAVLSSLFCLLTFKRAFVIQLFCLLIVSFLNVSNYKIPKKMVTFSSVIVIVTTLIFNYLIQMKNDSLFYSWFGTHAGDFTMGRNYRIWYPLSHYISYGFASTTATLGYNLEMDLIKIYMELGIVGLCIFVFAYMKICNRNFYLYVLMGTMFINLLFASGLTSTFGWTMRVITIACVLYGNQGWSKQIDHTRRIRFIGGNKKMAKRNI